MAVCGVCGSDGSTCRLVAELNDTGRRLTACTAIRQKDAARAEAERQRLEQAEFAAEERWRREHPRSQQPWPRLEGMPAVSPEAPTCPRCGTVYDRRPFRVSQLIECGQCDNPTRVRLVPHRSVDPALTVCAPTA